MCLCFLRTLWSLAGAHRILRHAHGAFLHVERHLIGLDACCTVSQHAFAQQPRSRESSVASISRRQNADSSLLKTQFVATSEAHVRKFLDKSFGSLAKNLCKEGCDTALICLLSWAQLSGDYAATRITGIENKVCGYDWCSRTRYLGWTCEECNHPGGSPLAQVLAQELGVHAAVCTTGTLSLILGTPADFV